MKKPARKRPGAMRAPFNKIPKYLRSEESAVIQLLTELLGWRFVDVTPNERFIYWLNRKTGEGNTVRVCKIVIPRNSVLAKHLDLLAKKSARNTKQRKARARRGTRGLFISKETS